MISGVVRISFSNTSSIHKLDDDAFNPSFLEIDRIIDEGEIEKDQVFYLVKWRAQTVSCFPLMIPPLSLV